MEPEQSVSGHRSHVRESRVSWCGCDHQLQLELRRRWHVDVSQPNLHLRLRWDLHRDAHRDAVRWADRDRAALDHGDGAIGGFERLWRVNRLGGSEPARRRVHWFQRLDHGRQKRPQHEAGSPVSLRRAGSPTIGRLLKKNGAIGLPNAPSTPGRIAITWYATVRHHRIVVARGSAALRAGASARVAIKLTSAGRALLTRSRAVKIAISGSFRSGATDVTAVRTLTLRR